eukprot:CAMPEP_0202894388 /NCGR_PEP_ID=MMETSP1392-20130828/3807_1 /ASSEMBLY_ACC=CAM_ASM_000868 /TAXON_ID=225041 /ORGANISM="Chlamydomonas chlamydogama, Strain SAG 11-48b" /LENGTH=30 /DNA_ID= /DNA_START= /DNA_END= /DNA_ORIENTATION=
MRGQQTPSQASIMQNNDAMRHAADAGPVSP